MSQNKQEKIIQPDALMEEENRVEQEDFVTISPTDIQRRFGKIIERVVADRASFLIKRQSKELAILAPLSLDEERRSKQDRILTTKYISRNRSILNEVGKGQPIWVSRRKKIVAKLVPPPPKQSTDLSEEDRIKLHIMENLSVDRIKIAIRLLNVLDDSLKNK